VQGCGYEDVLDERLNTTTAGNVETMNEDLLVGSTILDKIPLLNCTWQDAAGGRPKRFIPFSDGRRDCVGQALAKMNYTAVLAMLLGRFHFELAPEVLVTSPLVALASQQNG
jgi:Cytochrome P450